MHATEEGFFVRNYVQLGLRDLQQLHLLLKYCSLYCLGILQDRTCVIIHTCVTEQTIAGYSYSSGLTNSSFGRLRTVPILCLTFLLVVNLSVVVKGLFFFGGGGCVASLPFVNHISKYFVRKTVQNVFWRKILIFVPSFQTSLLYPSLSLRSLPPPLSEASGSALFIITTNQQSFKWLEGIDEEGRISENNQNKRRKKLIFSIVITLGVVDTR